MERMRENSTTLSAPYTFARCFNAQCPKAENCLRLIAGLYDTNKDPFITTVNPACIPTNTTECPYFRTAEKMRVAWGTKQIFDKVPYKAVLSIRNQLIGHFGKSAFYRFHREERFLSPDDQAYFRQVFRQKGITEEPSFERYTEEYKW